MSFPCVDFSDGRFYLGDCLEIMKEIPDGVVDMILCDLPYGTTQNKWDSIIPFEPLWEQYWRIAKPNAAIALTAQPPFDKILGASQLNSLKYEWIWEKGKATGHLNAKKQPLKAHENVLIFYRSQCTYNPQMTLGEPYVAGKGKSNNKNYGSYGRHRNDSLDGKRYPRSVVNFQGVQTPIHPTQKPVALFEYLIRTYTNGNDLVLDNCAGSGTTAIAAQNTKRRWVCIEKDQTYADAAIKRIKENVTLP